MNKQTLKTTIIIKKQVEEPVEVQICPICGSVPEVRDYLERLDPCTNGIVHHIYCNNCRLEARLQDWNKLSYEENEQCK